MENRKNKALKIVIIIIGVVLILFCLGFSRNGKNPHHFVLFGKDYIDTVESIERVDEVGNLYKIEYTANYHNPLIRILPNYLHLSADKGCSSFYKSDEAGINYT